MSDNYTLAENGLYLSGEARAGSTRQLVERIAELELAQDDRDWIALGNASNAFEFSRSFVTTITRLARLMFLKNPLISRGIKVKADYVFGRSVNISAKDEDINAVIQKFLTDKHNQTELTAQAARLQREIELNTDGNIFFVLVPHSSTGHIRIYTIQPDEITDIVTDPTNRKASWFYKREYIETTTNLATGEVTDTRKTVYYRDWRNRPATDVRAIGGNGVIDGQFVYHVKVGGFSDWKFGISEIYSPLDWAKAYKVFLENWSTIVAAYAKFAFKLTTTQGKRGVTAAKAKLGTTISTTSGERNPAPASGSILAVAEGNDLEPIRTAGATTTADDGRRLLLMVAAGIGLPETFFGDVSVGSLATATSLDRPTELMLTNRQTLWADIYHDILEFVLYWSIKAVKGELRAIGDILINEYGEEYLKFDEDIDDHIDIDFPAITVHSLTEHMTALTQASPFVPDARTMARMVLTALGENDIDTLLDRLYPEDQAPADEPPDEATDALTQAANDMRAALEAFGAELGYRIAA